MHPNLFQGKTKIKRVLFLFPGNSAEPVGGYKVAYEYANKLLYKMLVKFFKKSHEHCVKNVPEVFCCEWSWYFCNYLFQKSGIL